MSRYWLNPKPLDPEAFAAQVADVCAVYQQAPAGLARGQHMISCDEMTGIQALERAAPSQPLRPGQVERREFEYIRHGTLCLLANLEVGNGQVVRASLGATRTEVDFAVHIAQTVASAPAARWIFVVDQLNTHKSESLVRLVAVQCGITAELGVKEQWGILESMATRAAFLSDGSHRIRFIYVPKHTAWLNQVEIWFSILVRRLLRRASFASVGAMQQRIEEFIADFNKTAKAFKWTYDGWHQAA